ncbi:unnamed protein product [Brachionus calyciflorus]|uniref:Uncharacterized protein n=1 Tax=Brachionus calyciflorus TaxID=104777 RepID=A0A814PB37_9BILA|nr:unnamed protein product [Brachionus calyciflorus]
MSDNDNLEVNVEEESFDPKDANYSSSLPMEDFNNSIMSSIPIYVNIFIENDTELDVSNKFKEIIRDYITDAPTSAKRRQLHLLSSDVNLYHWTNRNNKEFNLSNRVDDALCHTKAQERNKAKENPLNLKLDNLNLQLQNLTFNNAKRTALVFEKEALSLPVTSDEANIRMEEMKISNREKTKKSKEIVFFSPRVTRSRAKNQNN